MVTLMLGATAAAGLVAALIRRVEARFAFFPVPGEEATPRDFGASYEPLTIETGDAERLHAWHLAGRNVRARILYFHGNGGNLSVWAPIVTGIARHDYSVLTVDYRGYGLSTGRPTERGLYRDAAAAVDEFRRDAATGVPALYWGRSLGVAMASYAATLQRPSGLILESGFPNVRSLVRGTPLSLLARFSTYRFPSDEFLRRLGATVPALVLHGDADQVVPITEGRALFDAIVGPKRFISIRGGDHNDAAPPDPEIYWGAVREFIESLRTRPTPSRPFMA
jgi:fermentation-respiration switch protein FrsA (DUF1100 family)